MAGVLEGGVEIAGVGRRFSVGVVAVGGGDGAGLVGDQAGGAELVALVVVRIRRGGSEGEQDTGQVAAGGQGSRFGCRWLLPL